MQSVLSPAESGEYIVKHAKYLKVLPQGISKLAETITDGVLKGTISINNFSQQSFHPKPNDPNAVEWLFVVDALNFCFWTPDNQTKYMVNGQTGYFALCAAINRAQAEGFDITNAKFYYNITAELLSKIFRSDDVKTKMPLLQERVQCLHQIGERLIEKWEGKFENVVLEAKNSAQRLLQLIVQEFPCFRDEAVYNGQRVSLYKRAQILIGDVWACYKGEGIGHFHDISSITMFADYRVPQVLIHFEALEYTSELLDVLRKGTTLKNGDAMEVEIRGASIYIVEKVRDAVIADLKLNHSNVPTANVNSILIDHFLWDYRRQHAEDLAGIPFHKCYSVYY